MNKIEVGEYVRDTEGKIYKIESETLKDFFCIEISSKVNSLKLLSDLDIQKPSSKNIIDLIEEGDYVNGYEVLDKYLFNGEMPVLETTGEETNCKCLCNSDIKSVVTKEQFESVKYQIEEEN